MSIPCPAWLDSVVTYRPYGKDAKARDGVVSSPSICEVPQDPSCGSSDTLLVSTCDLVLSTESATTEVFHSTDAGASWKKVASVSPAFWCSVFYHRGALYLLGTAGEYQDIVAYRSNDLGVTWSSPGYITKGRAWHCAPTPVVLHEGRLWRGFEEWGGSWPSSFKATVIHASEGADLLEAASWTVPAPLSYPSSPFRCLWSCGQDGFLEGNAVVGPSGDLHELLRVHRFAGETAALVTTKNKGGAQLMDRAETRFIHLPGGATKFTAKFDAESKRYWTVSNPASYLESTPGLLEQLLCLGCNCYSCINQAMDVRTHLVVMSSLDLQAWEPHGLVLATPPQQSAGTVDWVTQGPDMLLVIRCAVMVDGQAPANPKAGNVIGFKRVKNFRELGRSRCFCAAVHGHGLCFGEPHVAEPLPSCATSAVDGQREAVAAEAVQAPPGQEMI